jgi:signal transduction histidine kinase
MRLSLRHKSFLFFAAFELCMLIIFGALIFMLHQAEQESLKEERAKRIIGETQQLGFMFQQAGNSVAQYCKTHDTADLQEYDRVSAQLQPKYDWLREQFQSDPKQSAIFARVEQRSRKINHVLAKVRQHIAELEPMEGLQLMVVARNKVQPDLDALVKDALVLVDNERAIADESPERARKQRQQYQCYITGGFVVSTALALLALAGFLRQVVYRLRVMEENTRRLARQEALNPPLGGGDEIAHLDGVFHDVARALRESQEAERELQKMRKAFIAMVSHDLRTPLTSVRGFLELLEMGALGELSPKAMQHTQRTSNSVDRLIKLINDLLDLEKMESGTVALHRKPINLREVIETSLDSVQVLAANSHVKIEYAPVDVTVNGDADRLAQVVVNLLSNAIKFSPENGVVSVSVCDQQDVVEVSVRDQGRGVPERFQEIIFERFRQVNEADHSEKGGTGLGLPICKAMIEQHGGRIGVRSEEGRGSEFWFTLPKEAARSISAPDAVAVS